MKTPLFTDRSNLNDTGTASGYIGWRSSNFIQVSGSVVINVGRTREKPDRDAINWLFFYQLREQMTAKRLVDLVGVDATSLRAAFTRPDFDVSALVPKIEKLRAKAEAFVRQPAESDVFALCARGFRIAKETHSMVEVIVKTREGKTTAADWCHLKNMHDTVYVYCRNEKNERDFIWGVARAHGLAVGNGNTLTQLREQIRSMYGNGGLAALILDESHRIYPKNIQDEPTRIEFIRSIWDEHTDDVGIVSFATPQSVITLNLMMKLNERWAPGQYSGRVIRLDSSRKKPTENCLRKVARWHCPEGTDAMIEQLAKFAKISDGLLGSMINTLKVARMDAKDERRTLSVDHIQRAQLESLTPGSELEQKLRTAGVIK